MGENVPYSTFQGLRPHFDALARVGYFKIVLKPVSTTKRFFHNAYRLCACVLIIMYNMQHVIRVIKVRHSTNLIVDTLFILLTTLNTLGKQATFNLRSHRIDEIVNIINGPVFAARKAYHVEKIKEYAFVMSRLLSLYHGAIFACGFLWTVFPIVNRTLGEEVQFTGYFPFDTSHTLSFALALTYMIILIIFQAYGNVTMDCTIVAFYAQATLQIQMLRHNLEQLVEFDDPVKINTKSIMHSSQFISYKDEENNSIQLQERLKKSGFLLNLWSFNSYLLRYRFARSGIVIIYLFRRTAPVIKQRYWFVKEIESIFGEAMVVQFFVMAWVICMTMYKIVGLSIVSAEFVSMAMYLGCMLAQLFIYCYFGTQLKIESEFVNQSLYCSDWLCLSPRFRRQLLVMMQCCARPLAPRTAYVIPMSLETYIAVLRSSYTLFTFLNR